jgi:hypothetical protein
MRDVRIDHGPTSLLEHFFQQADSAATSRGIVLSFASFQELLAANLKNSDSWRPLISVFDVRNGLVTDDNSFCVVGRDAKGDIVACHAARLFSWSAATSFHDEATSLRMGYADPTNMKLPGEECIVTAQSTKDIRGEVVFSGAAWFRPDYRGRGLHAIMPRIGKACALARWKLDSIVSMMAESVFVCGHAPRFGYTHVDWDVQLVNSRLGNLRLAFLSMEHHHAVDYIERFSKTRIAAELDGLIWARSA